MMDLTTNNYIEIVISCFSLILFLLFFNAIRKNSENIFFSMRSSNLMQITNLSIFLSIIFYSVSDIFYINLKDNNIVSYILTFSFLFQIIIFVSLLLRYHRLYISCKTNTLGRDDLLQFKFFETKSYHYEYFYVRLMAIFIFIILIASALFYYLSRGNDINNIMYNYEILSQQTNKDEILTKKNYLFWTILSFTQTFIFLTYSILIIKTHLSPKVNISYELILLSITNYLYFLSIGLSFMNNNTINGKILFIFPLLYNLLIYFVTMGLPFLWGRFNETVINYDLPGELTSSLYLFLTKEKGFDLFYTFLYRQGMKRDKGIFYLDMLVNIFKYRMLIFTEQPNELITEEMNNIVRIYLRNNNNNYFDSKLVNQIKDSCDEHINNPKINIFDPITNVIYDYLSVEFQRFIKTEEFETLKNDLILETYVRCKLANYGLIRN